MSVRHIRVACFAIAVVLAWAGTTGLVHGLNNQPAILQVPQISLDGTGPAGPDIPEIPCESFVGLAGRPSVAGLALVGFTVAIDARNVKLWNKDPFCNSYREPLGDRFAWALTERPPGSTASLDDTDTLAPTLTVDVAGTYEVLLTVCPEDCEFGEFGTPFEEREVRVRFTSPTHLRPEYHPVMPPSVREPGRCDLGRGTCVGSPMPCANDTECSASFQPLFADDLLDVICQFGGAVLDPQWVTLQEWNGPQDYVSSYGGVVNAVEGVVSRARISSMDNEFNHHTIDANWNVQLDPIYRHLKLGSGLAMHNEWETASLPGSFQPSRGDRVSMWGYLIVDCGHKYKTEVHPPIGMAVHRERPVPIPSDWTSPDLPDAFDAPSNVGTGVWVPGIMTDVWFNRDAGEMIEGDRTGLHQPARHVPANCTVGTAGCFVFRGQPGFIVGGDAIEGLSPLDAVFSFRVHLPANPKAILESVGVEGLPDVPLYREIVGGNIPEERVDIEVVTEEFDNGGPPATYLAVRIDLRGALATTTPWLRIASGWVYPDPDNWGLASRRVRVNKLHVTNEADGAARGEGDWRLWLQVNNASPLAPLAGVGLPRQEWTRIVNYGVQDGCDFLFGIGCGEDETFGGRPWSTGSPDATRNLGPDVLVFPGQAVEVHTSGYEEDWFGGDSLGVIDNIHYLPEEDVSQPNACTVSDEGIPTDIDAALPTNTGCGYFTMHYDVLDLGAVDDAQLSLAGRALFDAYNLMRRDCGGDDVCPELPILSAENPPPPPAGPTIVHPLEAVLGAEDAQLTVFDTDLFEPRTVEPDVLNNLRVEQIREVLVARSRTEPEVVDEVLERLRETFDASRQVLGEEVLLDLELWRLAIPEAAFERHFGDLPRPEPDPGATRRSLKGAGKVGRRGKDATHLNVDLPCDPVRRPTKLVAQWGNVERFELDVILQVACEQEPDPLQTHAGRGLGRLNGVPGYVAAWTLYDSGSPREDIVRLRIFDPDGDLVREAIGKLTGNFKAREPRWASVQTAGSSGNRR